MKKITEIFREKKATYSFEFFPPKTEEGHQRLLATINLLARLKPDFMSVTYGAGGGNRERTFDVAQHIQEKHGITSVAHLTCVGHTKDEIADILENIKNRKINNVLALRGDPPKDNPNWKPGEENFKYSSELCRFIKKQHPDYFSIGVAGFPEGHVLCKDRDLDAKFLKMKIDNGADYVITQLFFDNRDYFEYVRRLRKLQVNARIIPGILPVTDYQNLIKFCSACGTTITEEVKEIFEPIEQDKEKTLQAGVKFAIRQGQELLAGGAPGLHFYTLNKVSPVDMILPQVRA
ncbi:MAG: methylenetetrahydrofolate reductase [NAD(P)H] [Candidatus Omnitrophota bacterium]